MKVSQIFAITFFGDGSDITLSECIGEISV